ncbi:signal peptidase I [Alkalicoccobacillus murimartini]|uniref:Signal peptidase I n=1 Tax=Alkalicoccobacillus murimartini TaxID=171685 RepID=A0ABT9YIR4_9BACI|nr:signal peptidase I [Alkalicoccobacillus murimartini]MDQ0207753.1 signal peptidase [Alkalicoccobacillus murimartini]
MKRTLSFVIKSFIGLLCLGVAFLFIQNQQQSEQTPNLFGYSALTILSNSMQPEFSEGDVIVIKQSQADELVANDIITFGTKEGHRVTHRITDSTEQDGNFFFTTKGDNNNVADAEPVFEGQVIGKVLFSIPMLGLVSRFVSEPIGFMVLIVLPLVAYVGITVYERLARPTKKEEAFK